MSATSAPVAIIMGSRSDWPTMKGAADSLDALGVAYEALVISAHRTPDRMYEFAKGAKGRGVKVIIAGAGGAAALPGMTASMTELPVLGVPVESKTLKGMDSLYSIVQMPAGIPVGTLAIGEAGAKNAGLLAASIVDIVDSHTGSDLNPGEGGALGSLIVAGRATELIDVDFYWRATFGGDITPREAAEPSLPTVAATPAVKQVDKRKLLVVDQSPFSQMLLRPLLTQAGYEVTIAPDPMTALSLHDGGATFDLIMADTTPGAAHAGALAMAFAKATQWRETPLVSLALQSGSPSRERSADILDTLSQTVPTHADKLKGAA